MLLDSNKLEFNVNTNTFCVGKGNNDFPGSYLLPATGSIELVELGDLWSGSLEQWIINSMHLTWFGDFKILISRIQPRTSLMPFVFMIQNRCFFERWIEIENKKNFGRIPDTFVDRSVIRHFIVPISDGIWKSWVWL